MEEASNNCFNLTIPVVMVCAVATLGTNHAKPFGPELQVKQMFDGRAIRAHNNIQFIEVFVAINYAHHDTILRGIL